ncbi:hypothetical protein G6553_01595 [Nocardioides sp. IC4_145]|uniref:hypothetical protein n=1 Tax=Nocardioides sp. IC4_145 TaxID=2714037 RepID=UPI00140A262A|nr:hypothetical protein [Nocardioides sp. IC4_145]NHC21868.1 hypothetical protein [Nocardioides sp. IC4_145]
MTRPSRLLALLVALLSSSALTAVSTPASAQTAAEPQQVRLSSWPRGATLTPKAKDVEEGDRLTLAAVIESPSRARKVTLQKYRPPLYVGDDAEWNAVKSRNVRGAKRVRFAVVATGPNTERYRAAITYKNAKPVTTQPVSVNVWRWIPLSDYDPYYQAEPYAAGFGAVSINGQTYSGWGAATYSHTGAWEARFTPGRHCKTFRSVIGVSDISHDGSSAIIEFTADDAHIYESPALTPGMDMTISLPLAMPYRFGIQLFDTTPGGTTGRDAVESWPVIGEPSFLCTGV